MTPTKVLITGGTGRVGKTVTERFVQHGWDVRVIDLSDTCDIPGVDYRRCDILAFDDMREAVRDCQVVVHLAAIPGPTRTPGPELFQINVAGTFNVFEAAAAEGIKRVVQASSINAFGCFWGLVDITPQYLPIDEAHPTATTDVYSFSKRMVEDVGAYYWRREGISSVGFRFPGVWSRDRMNSAEVQTRRTEIRALLDELVAQPEAEQQARIAKMRADTIAYRSQRPLEYPADRNAFSADKFSDDPLWAQYAHDRFNFWAYIDDRDAAQAMEKAALAEYDGAHALFVNAKDNWLDYDSETLARLFFPETRDRTKPLAGSEALVNIDKARGLIGFEPAFALEKPNE